MNRDVLVYAVKHKDLDTRMKSRSGGIFTALSDKILNDNGAVYGCILTDDYEAIHIRAEHTLERDKMRGSKYVQSDMRDVFNTVLSDLEQGKKVLFSGTSCQIAGLRSFLGKDYKELTCVDIVCHGVPSPQIWKDYLKWQESKYGECIEVDFRNKKDYGWEAHVETLVFQNKHKKNRKVNSMVYKTLFLGHLVLRPCCFKCPYKDISHPGDITIADYWGIDKAVPGFNDNKGVSLVLINSEKGKEIFEEIKDNIEYQKTRIEDSMQAPLIAPFEQPEERNQFWEDYSHISFVEIAKKYGKYGLKYRMGDWVNGVKRKIKKGIKFVINQLVLR